MMTNRFKVLAITFLGLIVMGMVVYVLYKNNQRQSFSGPKQSWLVGKDKGLPKKDVIVSALPKNASTVRLNLPTSISNLMISTKKGLGGLGVETNKPSVYDYVWMDVKAGTKINSIASGKVTKVDKKSRNEYEIVINFSYGLWGKYMAIEKPLVKVGANVREGQAIGTGLIGSQTGSNLLAFSIADENVKTGTKSSFSKGMIVKPLDYLKPDVRNIVLSKYK